MNANQRGIGRGRLRDEMKIISEVEALKEELAAAREVIEMLDGAINADEIEAAKSAALEFLREYPQ